MNQIFIFGFLILLFHTQCVEGGKSNNTVYDTKQDCEKECIGDHDLNCALPPHGDGNQHVCRCASGFYSRIDYCQIECEEEQFWSLFTYGGCSEIVSTVLPGSCNKQCVFRVRVWATVFIIIVFVAAVIVILALLPNLCVSCIACFRMRRQERHIEDLQIVSSEMSSGGGGAKGAHSATHPAAAYNYGYHAGYAPYGRAY